MQLKTNKIIDDIDKRMKGIHDTDTTIIHLSEEFEEISRQIYNQKIGRDNLDRKNMAEEIADVMMLLNKLATLHDIDVEKALIEKMDVLRKRHNLK